VFAEAETFVVDGVADVVVCHLALSITDLVNKSLGFNHLVSYSPITSLANSVSLF
jgi:hypothetical protein